MTAMKSTSFTSGIVDSVDKFAKNMIATAPIIPIGGGVSARSLKEAGKQIGGAIDSAADRNSREVVSPMLENMLQRNSGRV